MLLSVKMIIKHRSG